MKIKIKNNLDYGEDIGDSVIGVNFLEESGTNTDEKEANEAWKTNNQQQVIQEGNWMWIHIQPYNLYICPARQLLTLGNKIWQMNYCTTQPHAVSM